MLSPYVLLAFLAFAGIYAGVEKVKGPVKHAAHTICHVVTFGHKCVAPKETPHA